MLHTVKKVKYIEGFKLSLIFNDGKTKIVDFEYRLKNAKNMFLPLQDVEYFKQVRADGITIVWPNGLDLCPDVLYEVGDEIKNKATLTKRRKKSSTVTDKKTLNR